MPSNPNVDMSWVLFRNPPPPDFKTYNVYRIPPMGTNQQFVNVLNAVSSKDITTLVKKDAEYGSSWKKRGGVGAFMMLARKWDRLEQQVQSPGLDSKYDIFDAIEHNNPADGESVLETIRDLRRYLLLVESEVLLRKQVDRGGTEELKHVPLHNPLGSPSCYTTNPPHGHSDFVPASTPPHEKAISP
jgi:hypothetical protein